MIAEHKCCHSICDRAVVFSAPNNLRQALAERSSCKNPVLDNKNKSDVLIFADLEDPLFREGLGNRVGMGISCLWNSTHTSDNGNVDPIDLACSSCFASPGRREDMDSIACQYCFVMKHSFGHYLDLVNNFERPKCLSILDIL